jgi:hypothetical protein
MTREYCPAGYRHTRFATERRYPDGSTRQVVTTDQEEAKRILEERR